MSSSVGKVVGDLRAGKQPTDTLTLTLDVTIDPAAVSEFEAHWRLFGSAQALQLRQCKQPG